MRYLVKARLKPGRQPALLAAVEDGALGQGSVAGDEYRHNMNHARIGEEGVVRWIEVCFCEVPLEEERPYWEAYFDLLRIQDAHARKNCRDLNGAEPWACCRCDCTKRLEERLEQWGESFMDQIKKQ